MPASEIKNFSKLAVHTMTNKPWSLEECIDNYLKAGINGITVWRNVIEQAGVKNAGKMLKESGMNVVAHVRGGFFSAFEETDREKAIADNKTCIDEAAEIGADMVVLVCGAVPGMPLAEARKQITDGIAAVLPHAESNNIKLAIEPLHPMYAADRSAVNTMAQAREMCEEFKHPLVGIAADVYHIWWDPDLENEIKLAGEQNTLFAFHICDWKVDTKDLLTDRGLMGDGCINIKEIRGWVEDAGFDGYNEVEVFSTEYWSGNQRDYLDKIKKTYLENS
ncbi:MAG: sugar phosphate isomerase/epimerase family protein [Planctomycetota bacterium]|jgi:sugar phosphate isomerase/epimerase